VNTGYRTYWQQEVETRELDEQRRLDFPLLQDQIRYVWENSAFYKERFVAQRVHPDDFRSLDDLSSFPFIYKHDLSPAVSPSDIAISLAGPHQCAPTADIIRTVGTGGTSGKPLRIGWTQSDTEAYNTMGARALWALGVRPYHTVVNCFNYRMYAGGIMDQGSFEALGANVIAYGVGKSVSLLELLADLPGPICLYSTPSYALSLISKAKKLSVDLHDLNIELGVFSGEIGLQSEIVRKKIENAWKLRAGDLYGVAELGCQASECAARSGLHFFGHGYVHLEMIDPKSEEPIEITDGAVGELVYTSLTREACPLIRWRSGDMCEIKIAPCVCGRTSPRIIVLGRSDNMIIIGGMNVFPAAIQSVLLDLGSGLTGEFLLNRSTHRSDSQVDEEMRPTLLVERSTDGEIIRRPNTHHKKDVSSIRDTSNTRLLCDHIQQLLRQKLDATFNIQLVEEGKLPKNNSSHDDLTKAQRLSV